MSKQVPLVVLGRKFDGFERAFAAQFAANADLPARCSLVDLAELESSVLAGNATASGDYDLMLLLSDWLPSLIAQGKVLPLDDSFAQCAPEGWPSVWPAALRESQQGPDGRTYGVAYHDGPMLVLYRTDLYSSELERRGFEGTFGYPLRPPRTWTEFRDQAGWFTRPSEGLYGTVQAGFPDEHNNVYDFLTHLWSRGGDLIDANGHSGLDRQPAFDAVDYLHDLWHVSKVVDPLAAGWDSVMSGIHFADGEAAMMLNWCGFAALSADPSSPTHQLVGCAPAPGDDGPNGTAVTLNAYWLLAVPAGARDPERSIELMRRLTTQEMDVQTARSGGSATRLDSWNDPRVQAIAPYYSVLESAHQNSRSVPSDVRWPRIAGILNELMRGVVLDRSGRSALESAHRELSALLSDGAAT